MTVMCLDLAVLGTPQRTLCLCLQAHAARVSLGLTCSRALPSTLLCWLSSASTILPLVAPHTDPSPIPSAVAVITLGTSSPSQLEACLACSCSLPHTSLTSLPALQPEFRTLRHLSSFPAASPSTPLHPTAVPEGGRSCPHLPYRAELSPECQCRPARR